jgi:hypothetical protein
MSPMKTKNIPEMLNSEMRDNLLELQNLVSPLSSATNHLQGDGVTSSLILYQIMSTFDGNQINSQHFVSQTNLLHLYLEIAKLPVVKLKVFKCRLLKSIIDRFQTKINEDGYIILSALLDPRQKLDIFKSNELVRR